MDVAKYWSRAPGRYRVRGSTRRRDLYDAVQDKWLNNSKSALFVTIDSGRELPCGVVNAHFRGDGRRVIVHAEPVRD